MRNFSENQRADSVAIMFGHIIIARAVIVELRKRITIMKITNLQLRSGGGSPG